MTDGRTDGGDCNIPDAFLKKRGDNKLLNIKRLYRERRRCHTSGVSTFIQSIFDFITDL